MSAFLSYENILVSGVDYDFSQNRHENIPHRLFKDWVRLVENLAKVLQPAFNIPNFPSSLSFTTEQITSDGPYGADENYYFLDFVYCKLLGEKDGIMISFENGRQGGINAVSVETLHIDSNSASFYPNYRVSSHIPKSATSPLASFYLSSDEIKGAEILEVFAIHRESCLKESI